MTSQHKNRLVLLPLAWIFGLIQRGRNLLFDTGVLSSKKSSLRTIVVGNLAVGGTGKTPHVIWLAKELSKNYNLAILSRGYKRKSKGFHWVKTDDHPEQVGDEPLEMKTLLPDIPIAVDANRHQAIERILREINPTPDFVILDDGFQHRRLIPHHAIILSHAERPFFEDYIMPAGRLREPASSLRRANSMIITNTEENLQGKELDTWKKHSGFNEDQLFSSSFKFSGFIALSEVAKSFSPQQAKEILLVTGIAQPDHLLEELRSRADTRILRFRDHHNYTQRDIQLVLSTFKQIVGTNKILVTTGKDAVKLKFFPELQTIPMYIVGRQVEMAIEQKEKLIESILKNG